MDFSREFWGLLGMFFEVASRFFEIPTFSKVLVVPKSSKISKIALLAAGLKGLILILYQSMLGGYHPEK